jgi:16S rRNA (cytidine1402-2'-O)-methyltransferase
VFLYPWQYYAPNNGSNPLYVSAVCAMNYSCPLAFFCIINPMITTSAPNTWSTDFLNQQDFPASTLYMVATPIGNLGDITLRALHVLNAVDGIACEDTRHSAPLLNHFGIHKKRLALHAHNEAAASEALIGSLQQGERWAYISDAGTPGVSDPGARLAAAVGLAGFRVVPIPGASAVSCAVSVGGSALLPSDGQFQFLGFWPHKLRDQEEWLRQIAHSSKATVFFESPHQIANTLLKLATCLDDSRIMMIGRELTKKFEQVVHLRPSQLSNWLSSAESLKGEFIVVISASEQNTNTPANHAEILRWVAALKPFLGSKELANVISAITGISKKEAYQLALEGK